MDMNAIADWSRRSSAATLTSVAHGAVRPSADQKTEQSNAAQTEAGTIAASKEQLGGAVDDMNKFVQSLGRDIKFSLDDSTDQVVVKVVDKASGDVIRQMPSEEALRISKNMKEMRSLLFKAEA
jgi:flagellar protein FlaG